MSDEAAFLRALEANPADDTVRLVYADWLDERADPRGEYLRAFVLTRREPPRCRRRAVVHMRRRMKALRRRYPRKIGDWTAMACDNHWRMPPELSDYYVKTIWQHHALDFTQTPGEFVAGTGAAVVVVLQQLVTLLCNLKESQLGVRFGKYHTWDHAHAVEFLSEAESHLRRAARHLLSAAASTAGAAFTAVSPNSASSVSAVNVSLQSSE